MAIVPVGAGAPFQGAATNLTSIDIPMPSSVAVGDLLLMHIVSSVTANPTTPTGWAVFEPNLAIGSPGPTSITYFKWADSADTNTASVNLTTPTGKYEGHIAAYRGVDPTTPKDVAAPTGTQSATTTLAVPPPITTVTPGALVLLFAAANSASGVTNSVWSSSNMTGRVQGTSTLGATTNPTAGLFESPRAAAGSFQPDVSIAPTTAGRSSMRVVALRPAAAGSGSGSASGSWSYAGAASGQPTRDVSEWAGPVTSTTLAAPEGGAAGTWSFAGQASGGPTVPELNGPVRVRNMDNTGWDVVIPQKWTGTAWVPADVIVA